MKKPGTYIDNHVKPYLCTKFGDSSLKNEFRNAKRGWLVKWPIMRIFNEAVGASWVVNKSVSDEIVAQIIHIYIILIRRKHEIMSPCTGGKVNASYKGIASCLVCPFRKLASESQGNSATRYHAGCPTHIYNYIAKALRSMSIKYPSDPNVSDRYVIDVDPGEARIWTNLVNFNAGLYFNHIIIQ